MDLIAFDLDVLIKFRGKFKEFFTLNAGPRNSRCHLQGRNVRFQSRGAEENNGWHLTEVSSIEQHLVHFVLGTVCFTKIRLLGGGLRNKKNLWIE